MGNVNRKANPSESEAAMNLVDGGLLVIGWLAFTAGLFILLGVGWTLLILGACTMALGLLF